MQPADSVVLGAYLVALLTIGVVSAAAAGRSGEAFALADRKLRWWTLGFSDAASRSGHDTAWIAAIVAGGFLGLQVEYWIAAAVALPVGIVWSRYRRRLNLTSGPELLEARYGPRAAPLRAAAALIGGLGVGTFGLGVLLRFAVEVGRPATGWGADAILAVVLGGALLSALPGGLAGVVRGGVFQALTSWLGRLVFAASVIGSLGGVGAIVRKGIARRDVDFFSPLPIDGGGLGGVTAGAVLVLAIVSALGASRLGGAYVQRDLAASSPEDAARARTLQAFLSLGLRVIPAVLLGLAAIAIAPSVGGAEAGSSLARSVAREGHGGWIVVGLLAVFGAAVAEGLMSIATALWNDVHRPYVRPEATPDEDVLALRVAVLVVAIVAAGWAHAPFEALEPRSLLPAVAALGAATLPAAALRWLWWRFNLTGEVVAWVAAVPITLLVWGPLGLGSQPGVATGVVILLGGLTAAGASLTSKAHPKSVLLAFHGVVQPLGLWGPVAAMQPPHERTAAAQSARLDGASIGAGVLASAAATVAVSALFSSNWSLLVTAAPLMLLGIAGHAALTHRRRAVERGLNPGTPTAAEPFTQVQDVGSARALHITSPVALVPTGPVAPWPKHPEPFANSWGPGACRPALYASTWHRLDGIEDRPYRSADDTTVVHRAGVRWRHSVGIDGVVVRFAEGHVPRQARVGVRRDGGEAIEWGSAPRPAPGEEWAVTFEGAVVAVIVEQVRGGGAAHHPGVLAIAALTPILSRRPALELLLERPEGLHRPALPLAMDGCLHTTVDATGSHGLVLECNPPREIKSVGIEFLRMGGAGSDAVLGAWLASLPTIEVDGMPVKIGRRGLDGTMSGVVAGATRVVLRLDRPTLGCRIRLLAPMPVGSPVFIRRVTLDPRPATYPRRLPDVTASRPDRKRPTVPLDLPGGPEDLLVAPDGTLRWAVPGRPSRHYAVGMSLGHRSLAARERGRDLRAGILVDRSEADGIRVLRSILPAAAPAAGVELRLVVENLDPAPRSVLMRVARAEVEGQARIGPEDSLCVPVPLAGGGVSRVQVWIPNHPGHVRVGGRPGRDPEQDLVERAARLLAGTIDFRIPGAWEDRVRRLLVAAVMRGGATGEPPHLEAFPPSVAHGRWAEGLAVWGAGGAALQAFQTTFGGALRHPAGTRPGVVRAQGWSAEALLRWAGLGPEHAARISGRIGTVQKGPSGGPAEELDPALTALWHGDRDGFLQRLQGLEAILDPEVLVHLQPSDLEPWDASCDRFPAGPVDPRPELHCAGAHLTLLRHALLTEPPDARGARGERLSLFSGLPGELWGETIELVDAPSMAGPVSFSCRPAVDGRLEVQVDAPSARRIEINPPVGPPIVLSGGVHRIFVG